jgi:hypothetical protein
MNKILTKEAFMPIYKAKKDEMLTARIKKVAKGKKGGGKLFSPVQIVEKAKKPYPFDLDPAIEWIAMDEDRNWTGFEKKPVLVQNEGKMFWIDTVSEYIYPLGKSNYKENVACEKTLERVKK